MALDSYSIWNVHECHGCVVMFKMCREVATVTVRVGSMQRLVIAEKINGHLGLIIYLTPKQYHETSRWYWKDVYRLNNNSTANGRG